MENINHQTDISGNINMIQLELYQLKNMMMDMATLGAANYAKMIMPGKDHISQRGAYREYGEARVKRWVKSKMVQPVRSGSAVTSKIIYSRAELMSVDKAESINILINK